MSLRVMPGVDRRRMHWSRCDTSHHRTRGQVSRVLSSTEFSGGSKDPTPTMNMTRIDSAAGAKEMADATSQDANFASDMVMIRARKLQGWHGPVIFGDAGPKHPQGDDGEESEEGFEESAIDLAMGGVT